MITNEELRQFTGTENWYRHGLVRHVLYTDGVRYLAEKANAYWLVDAIASVQLESKVRYEEFQVWNLQRMAGNQAVLIGEDGNGNEIYRQDIPFTDFPLDEIKLYFTNNVLMLPSEY
jgi:hypothetical protein